MEGGNRATNNNTVATFDHVSEKVSRELRKSPDPGSLAWHSHGCQVPGAAAPAGSHG